MYREELLRMALTRVNELMGSITKNPDSIHPSISFAIHFPQGTSFDDAMFVEESVRNVPFSVDLVSLESEKYLLFHPFGRQNHRP